ncbi:cell envelope integrity protein TolA [Modicisalibacter xianhensis]|nr:cell envelope integrity protein TolA [Halomonas xianhensis]
MKSSAKIPYGLRDERLVHISQLTLTERGGQCGCVCPECKTPLEARMGSKVRHYFAHAPGTRPCAGGAETGIHLAAKQLIADRKEAPIPLLQASLEGKDADGYKHTESKVIFPGCDRQSVDDTKLEFSLGDIRPDLIVTLGQVEILVEVAVTHYIDAEKLQRLESRGLRCIEIDLGDIPRDLTPADLEEHVFNYHRAYWIVNPKIQAEQEKLRPGLQQQIERANNRIAQAKAAREREEQRQRERYAQREAYFQAQAEKQAEQKRQWEEEQRLAREKARKEADARQREAEEARQREAKAKAEAERKRRHESWAAERQQLDLESMRQLARELSAACQRIERHLATAPASSRLCLPMARRHVQRDIYRMDLEPIPAAIETRTEYDWMFGVPAREWKLAAFLGAVYTRENLQRQSKIAIQDIERCLVEFGYRPAVALHRAEQLLTTARYYQVLEDDPAITALGQLPRPLAAIAEFVAELDNFNMIQLQAAELDELTLTLKPAASWRLR